jgi:hypothetical protein
MESGLECFPSDGGSEVEDVPLEFVVPSLFAAALRAKLVDKPDEPYDELADEHFWGIGRIQRALKLTKGIRRRRT